MHVLNKQRERAKGKEKKQMNNFRSIFLLLLLLLLFADGMVPFLQVNINMKTVKSERGTEGQKIKIDKRMKFRDEGKRERIDRETERRN